MIHLFFNTNSYACLVTATLSSQLIYQQFFVFSDSLKECLRRDQEALKKLGQEAVYKTVNSDYHLWTAAWILWCLKNYNKDWPQFGACGGVKIILSQSVPSSEVTIFKNSVFSLTRYLVFPKKKLNSFGLYFDCAVYLSFLLELIFLWQTLSLLPGIELIVMSGVTLCIECHH